MDRPATNPRKLYAMVTPPMNVFFGNGTDAYMYAWFDFRLSLDNRDAYLLDGTPWWRVSVAQLAEETGYAAGVVRRSVERLVELGVLRSEFHYRDKKYRDRTRSFTMAVPQPSELGDADPSPFGAGDHSRSGGIDKCFYVSKGSKTTSTDQDQDFDLFWSNYPRKEDKQGAKKLFNRIKKTVPVEKLIEGSKLYAIEVKDREKTYIKKPMSWLNAGSWDNYGPETSSLTELEFNNLVEANDFNPLFEKAKIRKPNYPPFPDEGDAVTRKREKAFLKAWVLENKDRFLS